MHAVLLIAAVVLMLPAVLMPIVPMLPALPYLFLVAIGFGFVDGFVSLTAHDFLILLAFVAASVVVDQSAGVIGAKYAGAHAKSLFWGIGGAIAGVVLFPPFGGLFGLFAAVFLAELYYLKTHRQALKSASGAVLGAATGIIINISLAVAFIATFIFLAGR